MKIERVVKAAEADNDTLNDIVSKALGYPKPGVWVGGGSRQNTAPPTWDGKGEVPPGWTKHAVENYVASPTDTALAIPDATAAELLAAPAQARLNPAEKLTLSAALTARVSVDLDTGGYVAKPTVAAVAAVAEAEI